MGDSNTLTEIMAKNENQQLACVLPEGLQCD
jgi:hypothetical protein